MHIYASCTFSDSSVICARSNLSANDFVDVQTFCVIELGLPLIPISEDLHLHLPQVVISLFETSNPTKRRKNPFKFGVPISKKDSKKVNSNNYGSADKQILRTLQAIPGVGEKKGKLLLDNFGSIYQIADQSGEDLAKVIGVSSASAVHNFFALPVKH